MLVNIFGLRKKNKLDVLRLSATDYSYKNYKFYSAGAIEIEMT